MNSILALLLWMQCWWWWSTYAVHANEEETIVDRHQQQEKLQEKILRDAVKRLLQASVSQVSASSSFSESPSPSQQQEEQQQQLASDWRILLQAMSSSSLLSPDEEELDSIIQDIAIDDKHKTNRDTLLKNRNVNGLSSILNDKDDVYDCMEREFDVSSKDFHTGQAIDVFVKCRIVVMRNVFHLNNVTPDDGNSSINPFQQYMTDIDTGRIVEETGATSFGGDANFYLAEDDDRYNYMLTRDLVDQAPHIFANPNIIRILSSPKLLGQQLTYNHGGIITTWPSSDRPKSQYWHTDGSYVHGDDGVRSCDAAAGHDMPPFAINIFTPLSNLSMAQGPTEFCVGTSWIRGLNLNEHSYDDMDPIVQQLIDFEIDRHGGLLPRCPLSRRPLLNTGDVILFDYMLTHRGGPNVSDEMRSLMFAMYSRKWFHDTTFDTTHGQHFCKKYNYDDYDECVLYHITQLARFAIVERADDDSDGEDSMSSRSDEEL